jgi:ribokinase
MPTILVSGLINIETNLRVGGFPIEYFPVTYPFFGINSNVSGVGYNLAKAFTTLGNQVVFLSAIGPAEEDNTHLVRMALARDGIPAGGVLSLTRETPQSVILYDPTGRREIYTDLKDIQEVAYPADTFGAAMAESDLLAICNINFARPFLPQARASGRLVATDVHVLSNPYDEYNADFMRAADILFLSDDYLPEPPEAFARTLYDIYHNRIIVVGLGRQGALLFEGRSGYSARVPAVDTRPVVNTIGAGDALFTAFCHAYLKSGDSLQALRSAVVFASYKIGEAQAAAGYLDDAGLDALVLETYR